LLSVVAVGSGRAPVIEGPPGTVADEEGPSGGVGALGEEFGEAMMLAVSYVLLKRLKNVRRWVGGGHESRVARNEFAEVAEYMVRYENETSTY